MTEVVVDASPVLISLCVGITLSLAVALPVARAYAERSLGETPQVARRRGLITAAGVVVYLGACAAAAGSGALTRFDSLPPPMFLFLFSCIGITAALALRGFGRRLALGLPMWLLVGYQAFRIPVEIMLHRAYEEQVIGVQMTWSGLNFDVVTGITALLVGALVWFGRAPRWLLAAWNLMGLGLLVTIVSIAILSIPGPLYRFTEGPPNVWVTQVPFVWLPAMMVMMALFGHLVLARRLLAERRGEAGEGREAGQSAGVDANREISGARASGV